MVVGVGEHRRDLRAALPPWLVDHLVEIQMLAVACPETPNDTVEQVTGRPARRLGGFLVEHLDHVAGAVTRPLVS